jgi:hypothetical protein
MKSFRDDATTIESRLFGVAVVGEPAAPVSAPRYNNALKSKYFVRAVKSLYPNEVVGKTYHVQDDGDGKGPYFKLWTAEDGPPDDARIQEAVMELAANDTSVTLDGKAVALTQARTALESHINGVLGDGWFQYEGNFFPLKVVGELGSYLTYCGITAPAARAVCHYSTTTKAYDVAVHDFEAVRKIYRSGAGLVEALLAARDRAIANLSVLNIAQLGEVVNNPSSSIDRNVMIRVKMGL